MPDAWRQKCCAKTAESLERFRRANCKASNLAIFHLFAKRLGKRGKLLPTFCKFLHPCVKPELLFLRHCVRKRIDGSELFTGTRCRYIGKVIAQGSKSLRPRMSARGDRWTSSLPGGGRSFLNRMSFQSIASFSMNQSSPQHWINQQPILFRRK